MSLQIARTRAELDALRTERQTLGFVPTMGALHKGHLSLINIAQKHTDRTIVSIFVNPTQFAPNEDFDAYPRPIEADIEKLETIGADILYLPSADEIYPDGQDSPIKPGPAAKGLESDFRPHFFEGVVNVVSRLFDHVQPTHAIFGEKDYQQLCVIRQMVEALNLPIEIIGAPIIRDAQGLALSSRNAYLDEHALEKARKLNKIMGHIIGWMGKNSSIDELLNKGLARLEHAGYEKIDYLTLCDADTLEPLQKFNRPARLLAAAWLDGVRLIDNMALTP